MANILNVVSYDKALKKMKSVVLTDPTVGLTQNLVINREENTVTYYQNGEEHTFDLTPYDIHIDEAKLLDSTLILTDNQGTTYEADLAKLSESETEDSFTVKLTGNGGKEDPLSADVILSKDKLNLIEETEDGLFAKLNFDVVTKAGSKDGNLEITTRDTEGVETKETISLDVYPKMEETVLEGTEADELSTVVVGSRDALLGMGRPVKVEFPQADGTVLTLVLMDYSEYFTDLDEDDEDLESEEA